jgi:hypothetical protein
VSIEDLRALHYRPLVLQTGPKLKVHDSYLTLLWKAYPPDQSSGMCQERYDTDMDRYLFGLSSTQIWGLSGPL